MWKKTLLLTLLLFLMFGGDVEARRSSRRQHISSYPYCRIQSACCPQNAGAAIYSSFSYNALFSPCVCPLLDLGPHPSGTGNLYYAEYWHENCTNPEPDFLGGNYRDEDLPEECDGVLCVAKQRIFPEAASYPDNFRFPPGSHGDRHCEPRVSGQLVKFTDKDGKPRHAYLYKYRIHLRAIDGTMRRDVVYPRFGFETSKTGSARESDGSKYWGANRYHVTYDGESYIVLLRPSTGP